LHPNSCGRAFEILEQENYYNLIKNEEVMLDETSVKECEDPFKGSWSNRKQSLLRAEKEFDLLTTI
jgi:DNA-binding transcriptional regulator YhcF (GntR family)